MPRAFEPTEPISTYLVALIAEVHHGGLVTVTARDGREIPMGGVSTRASLAEHVDAQEVIEVTAAGEGAERTGYATAEEAGQRTEQHIADWPYPFSTGWEYFFPDPKRPVPTLPERCTRDLPGPTRR